MKTTLVILKICDDTDERAWWEILRLPAPERLNEEFVPETAFVHIVLEEVIEEGLRGGCASGDAA